MNYSERLIITIFLLITLLSTSCTFSEQNKGLEGLTGLNVTIDSSSVSRANEEVREFWSMLKSTLPAEFNGDSYSWTPIFSGNKAGFLIVTKAAVKEIPEQTERIKYKGESIYKWSSSLYTLALNDKLYCSSFPSALQLLIQEDGVSLPKKSLINQDKLIEYWIPTASLFDGDTGSKDWSIEFGEFYSARLISDQPLSKPDSMFRLKVRGLLKEGDSYFESKVERLLGSKKTQQEVTTDRSMIWRDGSLLLVYNNVDKRFSFSPDEIASSKSVYGMADIVQLNKEWFLKLSANTSYPIKDIYAFDWDGLLMMSADFKVLESMLSYLILEERFIADVGLNQQTGGFTVKDMKAFLSMLTGLSEQAFNFLPQEGFYTVSTDEFSMALDYKNQEDLQVPILLQHSFKKRSGEVFTYFDQLDRLFFLYQDDDQNLYCEDKDGRLQWYLPLEENLESLLVTDDLGILDLGNKLDYLDLKSGRLLDQPAPLTLNEVDTFGLIQYPDRPALENKVWMQKKNGRFKVQSLDQSAVWNLDLKLEQDLIEPFYFGFSDTTDYLLHFALDSLYGQDIKGNKLFDAIPLKPSAWGSFYKQNSAGVLRLIYPQDDGRVRVLNTKGQYFNLFLLDGMKGFLLENMNSGPIPEYIAYSDYQIKVNGYSGNDFKTFSSYESKEKIEAVQYASTPGGHYLACFKSGKIEILNEELELVAKMDCPAYEQAWFYFSDYDSALDLVLIDGDKVLNFILEEL